MEEEEEEEGGGNKTFSLSLSLLLIWEESQASRTVKPAQVSCLFRNSFSYNVQTAVLFFSPFRQVGILDEWREKNFASPIASPLERGLDSTP